MTGVPVTRRSYNFIHSTRKNFERNLFNYIKPKYIFAGINR